MKFAVYAPIFHDYGDPARLVELAVAAEASGYDGFFIWDHLAFEPGGVLDVVDATVVLGAVAQATTRLRIGAMVTPIARRRPWKLVRELVTLDHLSHGRVHLGIGLGEPAEVEFGMFGEAVDGPTRAARLDEGLDLFCSLSAGETVNFSGEHYQVLNARLSPRALQQPGIPVWAAATLPATAGLRRAARLDGVFPVRRPDGFGADPDSSIDWTEWWPAADEFAAAVAATLALRETDSAFDAVASGRLGVTANAGDTIVDYAAAGATWWFEWVDEQPGTFDRTLAQVRRGPPR